MRWSTSIIFNQRSALPVDQRNRDCPQYHTGSSFGLSFGASVKIDPDATLEQTRERGETYVSRDETLVPGIGIYRSRSGAEDPFDPFDISNEPTKTSTGIGIGAEIGVSHSHLRDSVIYGAGNQESQENQAVDKNKKENN